MTDREQLLQQASVKAVEAMQEFDKTHNLEMDSGEAFVSLAIAALSCIAVNPREADPDTDALESVMAQSLVLLGPDAIANHIMHIVRAVHHTAKELRKLQEATAAKAA